MKRKSEQGDILDLGQLSNPCGLAKAVPSPRSLCSVIDIGQHRFEKQREDQDLDLSPRRKNTSDSASCPFSSDALEYRRSPRPYRIHQCYRAQDGHSNCENQLYFALWQAGSEETIETKCVTIGWDRMARAAGMSDKSAQRNLRNLIEKLAVELLAGENSAKRTGKTYRIFSYKAILERRRKAGMNRVVKDKGVRFITQSEENFGRQEHAVSDLCDSITSTVDLTTTVDKTSPLTVDITSRDTVDITSSPLESILGNKKRKTTTTGDNLDLIVNALAKYVVADESAARKIMSSCRKICDTAAVEEIAAVISLKAPGILRNRSVQNPLGLLITSVPQCFEGVGIDRLRDEWAAEKARALERELELERQEAEMVAWSEKQCQRFREI